MRAGRSLAILLVEDDEGIRAIATLLLEAEGHRVHAVANGELAREWLKDAQPDLLFTDVYLTTDIGGIELAQLARQAHPGLPVLLTSGAAAPDPAWLAIDGKYINKPYDRRTLLAAIASLIGDSTD